MNLTIEEKLVFTRVKRAAIIWLLMLRLDPQPVTETLAAEIIQIDKETARKYLKTLQELQLITRLGRFDGYQLTDGGRQIPLPLQLQRLKTSAENQRAEPDPEKTNAGIPRSMCNFDTSNAGIPRSSAEIPRSPAPLKEEEEEEQKIIIDSSSAFNELLLNKAEEILKISVITDGIDLEKNTSENVLGWLAEAHHRRAKLRSPGAVVYSHLKEYDPARERYKLEPGKYLPENYLQAINREDLIPACQYCLHRPCICEAALQAAADQEPLSEQPDPRINLKWSRASMTPARAWSATLGQLEMEMPKAAFDSWVKELVLLDANETTQEITIGAQNDYARNWIESRLSSSLTRLLTGILNHTVEIKIRKLEFINESDHA